LRLYIHYIYEKSSQKMSHAVPSQSVWASAAPAHYNGVTPSPPVTISTLETPPLRVGEEGNPLCNYGCR
jgi:hypothetical protein